MGTELWMPNSAQKYATVRPRSSGKVLAYQVCSSERSADSHCMARS